MASVFRQKYTKKGVTSEASRWYVEYRDELGKTRRKAGYTDKKATQQFGARLEREAARRAEGLLGPEDGRAKLPLTELLESYRRYLSGDGDCKEYVAATVGRVAAIIGECGWETLSQIKATEVVDFLADKRSDRPVPALASIRESYTAGEAAALLGIRVESVHRALTRGKLECEGSGRKKRFARAVLEAFREERARGIGLVTSNHYLRSVKGFSRWLRINRIMPDDPLDHLSAMNVEADLRHRRRVLKQHEFGTLLEATRAGRAYLGLTGADRYVLYAVAANTGLRANELASLVPRSFRLDDAPPTATVAAAKSKRGTEDNQPMSADLAAMLRAYLGGRPATGPVWPGRWVVTAAEMIRGDLAAAGIPYEIDGEIFDFHALRHQYIDAVVRATPNPKEAQALARHSTITLTYKRYSHLKAKEAAGVLDRMPAIPAFAASACAGE